MITKISDPDFLDYITSFDCCFLSETFTLPSFDFDIYFKDFIVLHAPGVKLSKRGHVSGGSVLLIKKYLSEHVNVVDTQSFNNFLSVKFNKTLFGCDKDVVFVGIYNHPIDSVYYKDKDFSCSLEQLEQFIMSLVESGLEACFLIGGDLNARIADWSTSNEMTGDEFSFANEGDSKSYDRRSYDTVVNRFGHILIQFCSMFQLMPLNGLIEKGFDGNYTYFSERGNSMIDYFLTCFDFIPFVNSLSVQVRVESQHMPVCIDISIAVKSNDNDNSVFTVDKVIWDPGKASLFLEHLSCDNSKHALAEATEKIHTDTDGALDKFVGVLLEAGDCMKRTLHYGGRAKNTNKWFDSECRQCKRDVTRALNKYMRTRKENDWKTYKEKRMLYQSLIKNKKRNYKQAINDSLLTNRNNSYQFWKIIKQTCSNVVKRAHISIMSWKTHFEHVFAQQDQVNAGNNVNNDDISHDEEILVPDLDDDIKEHEIRQAIGRLKCNKAPGFDNISAEFLKASENAILPFVLKLFNHIFSTGNFPEAWTKAVIVPLFKKGDSNNPENYRGISLLSILSKVFTSIINTRLYNWAEEENKICEEQAGFRRGYSTVDHIFTLVSIIKNCLYGNKKKKFYVAFVDYKQAFDSVNRQNLWLILQKINMSTKMLTLLKGMYKSVQCCVKWGHNFSDLFECTSGVKQGCMLSPLIFSLLINEVAENVSKNGKHGIQFLPGLKEIFLLLFADDICLFSTTPAGLQNQINSLECASEKLGLSVNLQKTKIMVFRKGGHLSKYEKWFYQKSEIEIVNSYKYLGFTLTTKLSFDIALAEFAGRAKMITFQLLKTMWRLGSMDLSVFFKLFDAQVKPMLLYASEIWGLKRFDVIEKIHLFACKRLLNVYPRTPNTLVYGELGRYPLYIDSSVRAICYWFKLQNMPPERISRQAYDRDKNLFSEAGLNDHSFAFSIKQCLDQFGFSYVWTHGVVNEKYFIKLFKQRLIDCFVQSWNSKLAGSERFATYKSVKYIFQKEQYLNSISITKFRNIFARFRLGVCEININNRFKRNDTFCPFCAVVEDEMHFLVKCPVYDELRKKYLNLFIHNPDRVSLCFLLQNENADITRNVAMYIYYALKKREEMLSIV